MEEINQIIEKYPTGSIGTYVKELMIQSWNAALVVAADNADANYNFIEHENEKGELKEVYVIKQSILKFLI